MRCKWSKHIMQCWLRDEEIKAPQKMWDEDHSSAEEQWNKRSSKDPDDQIWDALIFPLFISLHWLPVEARIKFKTLMLAYRTTTGSAPSYFHSLLRIYIPSRSLRSSSEWCLVIPSQRGTKSLSRTFSFTVPGWWNDLPTPIRNAGSLTTFKRQLKTHLFRHYLTSS